MSKTEEWMPLYLGAYLADTAALTTLQHGAYILLIMAYWKRGPLTPSKSALATIARADLETFSRDIWPALEGFFKIDEADGLLHQKRVDVERLTRGSKKRTPPEDAIEAPAPVRETSAGSRLPADWTATGEYAAFARSGGLNPAHVGPIFRDYWIARADSGARKADWLATWRGWCRRTTGWREPDRAAASATLPPPAHSRSGDGLTMADAQRLGL